MKKGTRLLTKAFVLLFVPCPFHSKTTLIRAGQYIEFLQFINTFLCATFFFSVCLLLFLSLQIYLSSRGSVYCSVFHFDECPSKYILYYVALLYFDKIPFGEKTCEITFGWYFCFLEGSENCEVQNVFCLYKKTKKQLTTWKPNKSTAC